MAQGGSGPQGGMWRPRTELAVTALTLFSDPGVLAPLSLCPGPTTQPVASCPQAWPVVSFPTVLSPTTAGGIDFTLLPQPPYSENLQGEVAGSPVAGTTGGHSQHLRLAGLGLTLASWGPFSPS